MSSPAQLVRFADLDGRRVAWAAVGQGPPLVMGGWWMSHLELDWANRRFRDFVSALARYWTVVRYDRPGTGLSDRDGPPPVTLADEVKVLAGIVAAVARRIGGRLRRLGGRPDRRAVRRRAPAPGRASRAVRLLPGRRRDRGPRRAGAAAEPDPAALGARLARPGGRVHPQRDGRRARRVRPLSAQLGPAEFAARSLEAVYGYNVEDAAGEIRAPTAVLHRRNDRAIPFELGRQVAARIPGAAFVALEGADHLPWYGDAAAVARAALEFAGVERPEVELAPPADLPRTATESDLSAREVEVLRLVAAGLSDAEIAERLVLSPHTVHRHVANIRTKLRLPSRAAAVAVATRLGLL